MKISELALKAGVGVETVRFYERVLPPGILATARNVGMVLGIGISGAIFTTILERSGSPALVHAVQVSLYTAAGIAVVGAITASVRE